MWVNKHVYQETRDALVAAVAVRDSLASQNKALEVTNDWFRVRIGQLEHERALMLSKYMGIEVPVPAIERVREKPSAAPYNMVPSWDDVGDEEAKKLGITWNPDGSVSYGGAAAS